MGELAARIRAKYPKDYADWSDDEIEVGILDKYGDSEPAYKLLADERNKQAWEQKKVAKVGGLASVAENISHPIDTATNLVGGLVKGGAQFVGNVANDLLVRPVETMATADAGIRGNTGTVDPQLMSKLREQNRKDAGLQGLQGEAQTALSGGPSAIDAYVEKYGIMPTNAMSNGPRPPLDAAGGRGFDYTNIKINNPLDSIHRRSPEAEELQRLVDFQRNPRLAANQSMMHGSEQFTEEANQYLSTPVVQGETPEEQRAAQAAHGVGAIAPILYGLAKRPIQMGAGVALGEAGHAVGAMAGTSKTTNELIDEATGIPGSGEKLLTGVGGMGGMLAGFEGGMHGGQRAVGAFNEVRDIAGILSGKRPAPGPALNPENFVQAARTMSERLQKQADIWYEAKVKEWEEHVANAKPTPPTVVPDPMNPGKTMEIPGNPGYIIDEGLRPKRPELPSAENLAEYLWQQAQKAEQAPEPPPPQAAPEGQESVQPQNMLERMRAEAAKRLGDRRQSDPLPENNKPQAAVGEKTVDTIKYGPFSVEGEAGPIKIGGKALPNANKVARIASYPLGWTLGGGIGGAVGHPFLGAMIAREAIRGPVKNAFGRLENSARNTIRSRGRVVATAAAENKPAGSVGTPDRASNAALTLEEQTNNWLGPQSRSLEHEGVPIEAAPAQYPTVGGTSNSLGGSIPGGPTQQRIGPNGQITMNLPDQLSENRVGTASWSPKTETPVAPRQMAPFEEPAATTGPTPNATVISLLKTQYPRGRGTSVADWEATINEMASRMADNATRPVPERPNPNAISPEERARLIEQTARDVAAAKERMAGGKQEPPAEPAPVAEPKGPTEPPASPPAGAEAEMPGPKVGGRVREAGDNPETARRGRVESVIGSKVGIKWDDGKVSIHDASDPSLVFPEVGKLRVLDINGKELPDAPAKPTETKPTETPTKSHPKNPEGSEGVDFEKTDEYRRVMTAWVKGELKDMHGNTFPPMDEKLPMEENERRRRRATAVAFSMAAKAWKEAKALAEQDNIGDKLQESVDTPPAEPRSPSKIIQIAQDKANPPAPPGTPRTEEAPPVRDRHVVVLGDFRKGEVGKVVAQKQGTASDKAGRGRRPNSYKVRFADGTEEWFNAKGLRNATAAERDAPPPTKPVSAHVWRPEGVAPEDAVLSSPPPKPVESSATSPVDPLTTGGNKARERQQLLDALRKEDITAEEAMDLEERIDALDGKAPTVPAPEKAPTVPPSKGKKAGKSKVVAEEPMKLSPAEEEAVSAAVKTLETEMSDADIINPKLIPEVMRRLEANGWVKTRINKGDFWVKGDRTMFPRDNILQWEVKDANGKRISRVYDEEPTTPTPAPIKKGKTGRTNIKAILADDKLRKDLMTSTIVATQAREGIETTPEQAAAAYDKVQGEKQGKKPAQKAQEKAPAAPETTQAAPEAPEATQPEKKAPGTARTPEDNSQIKAHLAAGDFKAAADLARATTDTPADRVSDRGNKIGFRDEGDGSMVVSIDADGMESRLTPESRSGRREPRSGKGESFSITDEEAARAVEEHSKPGPGDEVDPSPERVAEMMKPKPKAAGKITYTHDNLRGFDNVAVASGKGGDITYRAGTREGGGHVVVAIKDGKRIKIYEGETRDAAIDAAGADSALRSQHGSTYLTPGAFKTSTGSGSKPVTYALGLREKGPLGKAMTAKDVGEWLPEGFKLHRDAETGDFVVNTPGGPIRIRPEDNIPINFEMAAETGHSAETLARAKESGRSAAGVATTLGGDALIRIVDQGEIPHEIVHVFLDHFANAKQRKVLDAKFGAEAHRLGMKRTDEVIAKAGKAYYDRMKANPGWQPKGPVGQFFKRVYDFVNGVYRDWRPTSDSIFKKIYEGKAFSQERERLDTGLVKPGSWNPGKSDRVTIPKFSAEGPRGSGSSLGRMLNTAEGLRKGIAGVKGVLSQKTDTAPRIGKKADATFEKSQRAAGRTIDPAAYGTDAKGKRSREITSKESVALPKESYSLGTWNEGRADFEAQAKAAGLDKADIERALRDTDRAAAIMAAHPNLLPVETKGSPVRMNQDFFASLDFDAICPRSERLFASMDEIQSLLTAAGDASPVLNRNERIAANIMMRDMGLTPQCTVCYTGSGRSNAAEMTAKAIKTGFTLWEGEAGAKPRKIDDNPGWHKYPALDGRLVTDAVYREAQLKNPEVAAHWKAYKKYVGGSGANVVKPYSPWKTGTLMESLNAIAGKMKLDPEQLVAKMRKTWGLRIDSNTDFKPWMTLDFMQAINELWAEKMPAHQYLKEEDMILAFGKTGVKMNASLQGEGNARYEIEFDAVEGMDPAFVREMAKRFPDVGGMLLGTNEKGIIAGMRPEYDDVVGQIIPFHRSGARVEETAALGWTDFDSKTQAHETPLKPHELKAGQEPGKVRIESDVHKNDVETYLAECEKAGVRPRFRGFIYELSKVDTKGKPVEEASYKGDIQRYADGTIKRRWTGIDGLKNTAQLMKDAGVKGWDDPKAVQAYGKKMEQGYMKNVRDFARVDTPHRVPTPDYDMNYIEKMIGDWQGKGEKGGEPQAVPELVNEFIKRRKDGTLPTLRPRTAAEKAPLARPEYRQQALDGESGDKPDMLSQMKEAAGKKLDLTRTAGNTATSRGISAPAKAWHDAGLIAGKTVFDWGAGKGADIPFYKESGATDVKGYDPNHMPTKPEGMADVVASTYVGNVLPPAERQSHWIEAMARAKDRMLVTVRNEVGSGGIPYKDGVLVKLKGEENFQRAFTQDELLTELKKLFPGHTVEAGPRLSSGVTAQVIRKKGSPTRPPRALVATGGSRTYSGSKAKYSAKVHPENLPQHEIANPEYEKWIKSGKAGQDYGPSHHPKAVGYVAKGRYLLGHDANGKLVHGVKYTNESIPKHMAREHNQRLGFRQ